MEIPPSGGMRNRNCPCIPPKEKFWAIGSKKVVGIPLNGGIGSRKQSAIPRKKKL